MAKKINTALTLCFELPKQKKCESYFGATSGYLREDNWMKIVPLNCNEKSFRFLLIKKYIIRAALCFFGNLFTIANEYYINIPGCILFCGSVLASVHCTWVMLKQQSEPHKHNMAKNRNDTMFVLPLIPY